MMTDPEDITEQRGLAEKLNAVQQYTQALQELAGHMDEARDLPEILIGVLCLMAYFEVSSHLTISCGPPCDLPDSNSVV